MYCNNTPLGATILPKHVVDFVCLSICLRVIDSIGSEFSSYQMKEKLLERVEESTVPVTNDVPRQAMQPKNFLEE